MNKRHPGLHSLRTPALIISAAILAATASCSLAPTPFQFSAPTPDCGAPTLVIGSATFSIHTFKPSAGEFPDVPPDARKIAFWIEGTDLNYVFVVSPSGDNLAMEAGFLDSVAGNSAKVTWTNCNSTTYTLSAATETSLDAAKLPEQSSPGITIFFEKGASGAISLVHGDLAAEEFVAFDTPTPGGANVQAELTLGDITPSTDGNTVMVAVYIRNTGAINLTVSASDVSLTSQDGTALPLMSSNPGLPKEIKPAATAPLTFTFARPSSKTATLKIFDVEYDIEGY